MNVLLAGMKHCGKSTAGAALAARWSCPFYDIDQLIEAEHERAVGQWLSVRDIYGMYGEDYFTRLETEVVHTLAREIAGSDQSHVAALGGPTPMNPQLQEALHDLGVVVYLRMCIGALFERVERSGLPAFLEPDDPAGHFARLCLDREPHYLRLSDLVVNADGLDVEAVVELLVRRIEEHTHGR